ncbi:hypothetical protein COCC4DRAFT_60642 [Bipolaris maydis ATCC 48331]|uniref:EthD domain-containing protein n=2 Tax=Cochliobolus heterostrophus TaxID=5016 RepID=M2TQ59_COCH5|nr:uncharacterized protein COCC4DRAFT_60642 [Bipolaris maydis ATCC 48331]EMD88694.1 hypothetical protein COCHEDRAFT_19985 [Bipolaris maydis C5]KAJ5028715.1 hypothetical protein J3E73DRAFT_291701 [Bipolaris maydis]ENI05589.1 hypothetical protein COCC4DRAFT_60642 [Bipolaris maydis ATCC 48331]KAJ5063503.1 hypothetical protein J3E74DRAFT_318702 [Bipolaris maydis]KAJ6199762.1 hypothetical protein J3E72DRAFT_305747 [Bipolaris maydis]
MSRIAVVWSGLTDDDEEAQSWYENRHVPATIAKLESSARTAEQTPENPFQEVKEVNGKHMTIYDLPEEESIEDFEAKIGPALGDVPVGARLNTRSYKEYVKVHGDEWRDDPRDVRMWATVLWQPKPEVYDEFIEWFTNSFIPGMFDSPELLRARVFTLEHATNIRAQKYETVDKDSLLEFLTIWEFETEEFPWEVLIYLGSSEKWRYYMEGGMVDWEIAQYMVKNNYPGTEEQGDSAIASPGMPCP